VGGLQDILMPQVGTRNRVFEPFIRLFVQLAGILPGPKGARLAQNGDPKRPERGPFGDPGGPNNGPGRGKPTRI
jgi:hypothetical protein